MYNFLRPNHKTEDDRRFENRMKNKANRHCVEQDAILKNFFLIKNFFSLLE